MNPRVGLRGKLLASYASATLVLLLGLATFAQGRAADHALREGERARLVARGTFETEVALLEAETGQRGYLLTRDEPYLEPYLRAAPEIHTRLAALADLVEDDPEQAGRVKSLGANAERKLAEMEETLQLARSGGQPLTVVETGEGRRLGDAIRADVAQILAGSRLAREDSERRLSIFRTLGTWLIGTGNLVAFALAAAITAWIAQAISRLREANIELARRADKLTAQERLVESQLHEQRLLTSRLEVSNQALLVSNTDLEQFAYVASHDLRAPLRGIANVSEWLEDDLGTSLTPPVKRHLDALRGRVHRLEALIDGIAAYSRAGRAREAVEPVDVAVLVKQVIDLVAPPPSVHVAVTSPLPALVTPRTPLQQVFLNLLSNAIKHGAARGGTIRIGAVEEPERWQFSVADSGPGIAPEYHEKIFALFQTLAPRDKIEGTGIGLAVVKKLTDRFGGSVRVDSAPGAGATFTFTWPKRVTVT